MEQRLVLDPLLDAARRHHAERGTGCRKVSACVERVVQTAGEKD
jgi:hypothetical protein